MPKKKKKRPKIVLKPHRYRNAYKTLTKYKISRLVAYNIPEITVPMMSKGLDVIFDSIKAALLNDEAVYLDPLGTFKLRWRRTLLGRPRKNSKPFINARFTPWGMSGTTRQGKLRRFSKKCLQKNEGSS